MNCGNCGTALTPGNNICPKCGALNMGFGPGTPVGNLAPSAPSGNVVQNAVGVNPTSTPAPAPMPVEHAPTPVINVENVMPVNQEVQEDMNVNVTSNVEEVPLSNDNVNQDVTVDTDVNNVEVNNEESSYVQSDQVNLDITSGEDAGDDIEIPLHKDAQLSTDINGKKKFKIKLNFKFDTKKKVPILVCMGGIGLAIILGILLGSMLFSKNYCAIPNNTFNSATPVVADGKNNITQIGHFIYKIPNVYLYDRESNGVSVYDKEAKYKIFIKSEKGSFDAITSTKTSVKATLTEKNIVVNNIKEMKIEEKSYFIIEIATKAINRMIVFTDASNGYVFYSEIMTANNEYNYDVIKILDDILKNAKYSEAEASTMEKIDVVDPSAIVIKASEEYKNKVKS